MTPAQKDALWRKAAVLGSLWAASEIVLGSFLHNAHVPLAGHLLTGIGVIILVAGHRLWPERGLLWRAGLVCAVMKSVSPSAVIMGPMIAIAMEAFLLEAGVFLAGATPVGYLLGGGLAMSWPFLHQTGNLVIMYGTDTVAVYLRGLEQVRAWTGLRSTNPWTPLAILGAAHCLGGSLAGQFGLVRRGLGCCRIQLKLGKRCRLRQFRQCIQRQLNWRSIALRRLGGLGSVADRGGGRGLRGCGG